MVAAAAAAAAALSLFQLPACPPTAADSFSAAFKAKGDVFEDVFRKGSDSRRYDFVILLFGKTGEEWFITQVVSEEIDS